MRGEILLGQRGKTLSVKDMYADLEKIEARGKRKKEKGKGLFSSFGRKDEPEPDEPQLVIEESMPEPPAAVQPPPPESKPRAAAPPPQPENSWNSLTGGKLKKAEEDLLAYKKWLNTGYKSGVLTKEQCVDMVRVKEIELGLRPPE